MEQIGRMLVIFGVIIVLMGVLLILGPRLPFRIGRLPLDFTWHRNNFTFYFPLGTSILISLILTLVLALFSRR